ncbi:hypothetical protein CLOSYM_02845 [[Clostridium] symbiosum ATCC 14940]|uniref:Uncharacterized protein n=1 Tax=[Clostridium] symbiosum ATCC 14940 TaxID=411472 RepID=A0ABC9TWE1_CLOSY|nr:hypothetical protein CLOSYM_02845 [[Clostridium] symbiosum ATCC 14940]
MTKNTSPGIYNDYCQVRVRLECAPENGFGGNLQTGSQYRQTEG